MEVIYGRISSVGQKDDTQLKEGVKSHSLIQSAELFHSWKDHKAKKLIAYLEKNPTTKTICKRYFTTW